MAEEAEEAGRSPANDQAGLLAAAVPVVEELEGEVAVCAAVDMAGLDSDKMMGTGRGEMCVEGVQVALVWPQLQGQGLRSTLQQVPRRPTPGSRVQGMGLQLLGSPQAQALRSLLGRS